MSNTKQPVELAICMGSSCFSRGNKDNLKVIREYIERHGLCEKVQLKGHLCEGLCEEGPNIAVEGGIIHGVEPDAVDQLLDQHIKIQE